MLMERDGPLDTLLKMAGDGVRPHTRRRCYAAGNRRGPDTLKPAAGAAKCNFTLTDGSRAHD
jgi:hypothetical protein